MDVQRLGKYEIRGRLGRGAMGTVYDGWDPIIARRVAIKAVQLSMAFDPETEPHLVRFRREAEAAGRLIHPNIVSVFDYGETADTAYIVMEFVDGPSLKSLMEKQQRFSVADTVRIMEDVLAGLQFSHQRGVVHRDIKPANVMLAREGRAKIADFGIARIENSGMTQTGTVIGTPAYMSPEQFTGQPVDARSDIYSAGVLLYQLLTGERPFEGGVTAIMHRVLNTEAPLPSQLSVTSPPAFDDVVRTAMARRPEERYASAEAFANALRAAASSQTERVDATTIVLPPRKVRRLSLLVGGVIACLAVLGAAGALLLSLRASRPASHPIAEVAPPPVARPEKSLQSRLDEAVANVDCLLARADVSNAKSPAVYGLSAVSTANGLRQSLAGIAAPDALSWRITSIDPRLCDVLNLMRPIVEGNNRMLALVDANGSLRDGELIRLRVTMPQFDGELRVDYVSRDGTVVHFYPSRAMPSHRFINGETLDLGDPEPGQPTWKAEAPYGTNIIIAIASAEPLLAAMPTRDTEPAGANYLRELHTAIDAAQKRGVRVVGAVLPVDTLPSGD